ncbi:MAG TPA: SDR family oxidoreductase [Opitutaceae bacterium]|jgi:NAD(P)-dependent dehydrogenase (short-subunit alcohol dehydrogenase family)|nr:SDR family oxidoreductase [Opitutaceae bacterium]
MKNKTILITGGTTGIGLATAQLLQAEGARVLVTGRNPETLAAARTTLGANAVVIPSDSGSLADAQGLGAAVQKHTAKLDGVFLNAGGGQFGPFEALTPKHFDDMFNVNVRGPYFQLQSLLPLLANPSAVVFTASVAAELGLATTSIYAATKAALVSFGKTLAVELAPRGIRVNTISPGPIATPIFGKLNLPPEAVKGFEEAMAAQSLFKRFGTASEVAKLTRFLLSEDSSYVVGVNYTVDGGVRLT